MNSAPKTIPQLGKAVTQVSGVPCVYDGVTTRGLCKQEQAKAAEISFFGAVGLTRSGKLRSTSILGWSPQLVMA
jgi:hypothetical protein